MIKRTIAMVIAAILMIACIPVLSFANSPSPTPEDKYTFEVKSDNPNAGTVVKTRISQDKWKVVATPNSGYKFVKWEIVSGDSDFDPDKETNTVIVTVNADTVVKAVFSEKGSEGDKDPEAPETGYSIALAVFACVSSLAGAAFVAKKLRA